MGGLDPGRARCQTVGETEVNHGEQRKDKQLERSRLAALHEGDQLAYNKARAQQDILADLLDKWGVSIEDAGIDYTRLAPDMP